MSEDKRVFMYKGNEARLFDSIEDVPAGEGWTDHPTATESAPAVEPVADVALVEAVDPAPVETSDEISEIDALRAHAQQIGIDVDNRWGVAKLKVKIAAQLAED